MIKKPHRRIGIASRAALVETCPCTGKPFIACLLGLSILAWVLAGLGASKLRCSTASVARRRWTILASYSIDSSASKGTPDLRRSI